MQQGSIHLENHIKRDKESDTGYLKNVIENTNSKIDPRLTKYNVRLADKMNIADVKNNIVDYQNARDELGQQGVTVENTHHKQVAVKRQNKNTKMFATATIQISDDTLEDMGWRFSKNGKKLPTDKQDPAVIKKVIESYRLAVNGVNTYRDKYGSVAFAELHFDESSPHVDMVLNVLDKEKPLETIRSHFNGPTDLYSGHNGKMRQLQDDLETGIAIQYGIKYDVSTDEARKVIVKAGLNRGEEKSKKQTLKEQQRELKQRERDFEAYVESLELYAQELADREKIIAEREEKLNDQIESLAKREELFEKKKRAYKKSIINTAQYFNVPLPKNMSSKEMTVFIANLVDSAGAEKAQEKAREMIAKAMSSDEFKRTKDVKSQQRKREQTKEFE